jgi:hypothetical protein
MDLCLLIEAMIGEGHSFTVIEQRIEELPTSQEVKSALWLLAWAEAEPHVRRRVVREMVTGVPALR